MTLLIDREYPFCSESKELRLVMRALRSGWVDGQAASELIDQALSRVTSGNDLRETLSVLRAAIAVDRRRRKRYVAEVEAQLKDRREAIRRERWQILAKQSELREWARARKS